MSEPHTSGLLSRLGRRSFLVGAGAAGLALPTGALVACAGAASDGAVKTKWTAPAGGSPVAQTQAVDLPFLPNPAAAPAAKRGSGIVKVEIESQDVQGRLAEGVGYTYWTFNGTVPGPMIRVSEGDQVELTLRNREGNAAAHNIDLHAVDGPGGGAAVTLVKPGDAKTFRFKAQHPGVYMYHCAVGPVAHHISQGMYGMIVVEPAGGLPPVDREFYVGQGDIYTKGAFGDKGLQEHDAIRRDAEQPTYVVFNGAADSLTGDRALKAKTGERIRMFFGVGGPNLTSSFHIIGAIFDRVANLGSLNDFARNVQTVTVPPGGATMVEFTVPVPGTYLLVDHAISRLSKGCVAHLVVEGADNPDVFQALAADGTPVKTPAGDGHGGH